MSRLFHMSVLALTAFLAVVSGAFAEPAEDPAEPSRTLRYSTYFEKKEDVTLIVGSRIASYHPDEAFVPLEVSVRVKRRGQPIRVGEESFTLIDAAGNTYQAVGLGELRAGYNRLDWDWSRLAKEPKVASTYFNNDQQTRSRFYPGPNQGPRLSPVRLRGGTFLTDLVYFPRPTAGLGGVLTLRLAGGGLTHPLEVRFEVPTSG